ncbi:MAG: beta-lactamase family protein [Myxococcales bacterium]|nr:beta-lactamase family protein [Myxococcales bacterium]MCB9754808.1 beta-lactamase family protein [Myxococcales bacterium]
MDSNKQHELSEKLDRLEARALDAWTPMEPPVGFTERVMAAAADSGRSSGSRRATLPLDAKPDDDELFVPWKRPWLGLAVAAAFIGTAIAFHFASRPKPPEPPPPAAQSNTVSIHEADKVSPTDKAHQRDDDGDEQARGKPFPPDLHQKIEGYVQSYGRAFGEQFRFNGTVAVARAGETHFIRSYGIAQRGSPPMTHANNTIFRLGSLTEQITAVAVMQLVEAGKVELDDGIRKHVPKLPESFEPISVRDLLSHTSGLPNFTDMPEWETTRARRLDTDALIDVFKDQPLEHAPGEVFAPTNSGYAVLGALIEAVSGQTYERYVLDNIAAKAGMEATALGEPRGVDARLAHGYTRDDDDKLVWSQGFEVASYGAAGGLVSTPLDVLAFDRALFDGRLLRLETRALMFDRVIDPDYSHGWIVEERFGQWSVSHPGGIDGFNSMFVHYLEDDTTVLCMTNSDVLDCRDIADDVSALIYNREIKQPLEHAEVPLDPARLPTYVGHFTISEKSREHFDGVIEGDMLDQLGDVEFFAKEDSLYMYIPSHGTRRMYALAEHEFFYKDYQGTTARFHVDVQTGKPRWVSLKQDELEFILLPGTKADDDELKATVTVPRVDAP